MKVDNLSIKISERDANQSPEITSSHIKSLITQVTDLYEKFKKLQQETKFLKKSKRLLSENDIEEHPTKAHKLQNIDLQELDEQLTA